MLTKFNLIKLKNYIYLFDAGGHLGTPFNGHCSLRIDFFKALSFGRIPLIPPPATLPSKSSFSLLIKK